MHAGLPGAGAHKSTFEFGGLFLAVTQSLGSFLQMTTRRSVSKKGLRRVSSVRAGSLWDRVELTKAFCWNGLSWRPLQETDEPNKNQSKSPPNLNVALSVGNFVN